MHPCTSELNKQLIINILYTKLVRNMVAIKVTYLDIEVEAMWRAYKSNNRTQQLASQ